MVSTFARIVAWNILTRHIIGMLLFLLRSFMSTRETGFEDNLRKDAQPRAETSLKKTIYHTRILSYDPDEIFRFTGKILIFIPELFLCACLICHARHKPKKARNQSRSSSQEHEPNHFLFVHPPLSFHCGRYINMLLYLFSCISSCIIYIRFPTNN